MLSGLPPALVGTYGNQLLALAPDADLNPLRPYLRRVRFQRGECITNAGKTDRVFFVDSGLASIIADIDGKQVETCAVGRESALNVVESIGTGHTCAAGVMQVAGDVTCIPIDVWSASVKNSAALQDIVGRHIQLFLAITLRNVGCASHHSAHQRLCRKLLSSRDRTGLDTMPLTQQFLASMLGVERTTIGDIASDLQRRGFIAYRHGKITVVNPQGLSKCACECYHEIYGLARRIFPEFLTAR